MVVDALSHRFNSIVAGRSEPFITNFEVSEVLNDIALQALLDEDSQDRARISTRGSILHHQDNPELPTQPVHIGEQPFLPVAYIEILNNGQSTCVDRAALQAAVDSRIQSSYEYISRIKGGRTDHEHPPRIVLLAILVYGRRYKAIKRYFEWLKDGRHDDEFPKDEELPVERNDRLEKIFEFYDTEGLYKLQKVFVPWLLEKHMHQTLDKDRPKPFILQSELGAGASGAVRKLLIPAGCWVDAGTKSRTDVVLAVKRFQAHNSMASASAERYFENEKRALGKLRQTLSRHENIMLDMGSLTENPNDAPTIYWMFFPLGLCDLHTFLTDPNLSKPFSTPLTPAQSFDLYKHTVSIIHAVAWLDFEDFRHLDIKPQNILVFEEGNNLLRWKIADFNFAFYDRPRLDPVREVSRAASSSSSKREKATAVQGIFQAPEVRESRNWQPDSKSDVWAIGAVLLMVMTFMHGREPAVLDFMDNHLTVHYPESAPKSFYVTDEMYEWSKVDPAGMFDLDQGSFVRRPLAMLRSHLEAPPKHRPLVAVNPKVTAWMDDFCKPSKARACGIEHLLDETWVYLRADILTPDKNKRHDAKRLKSQVEHRLHVFEHQQNVVPSDQDTVDPLDSQPSLNPLIEVTGPNQMITPIEELSLTIAEDDMPNFSTPIYTSQQITRSRTLGPIDEHTKLCQLSATGLREALEQASMAEEGAQHDVDERCPKCREYLVHSIVAKKQHDRLQALLELEIPRTIHVASNHSTPFQLALSNSDEHALEILREYAPSVFDESEYKEEKRDLTPAAMKVLIGWKKAQRRSRVASSSARSNGEGSARRSTSASQKTTTSDGSASRSFMSFGRKKR